MAGSLDGPREAQRPLAHDAGTVARWAESHWKPTPPCSHAKRAWLAKCGWNSYPDGDGRPPRPTPARRQAQFRHAGGGAWAGAAMRWRWPRASQPRGGGAASQGATRGAALQGDMGTGQGRREKKRGAALAPVSRIQGRTGGCNAHHVSCEATPGRIMRVDRARLHLHAHGRRRDFTLYRRLWRGGAPPKQFQEIVLPECPMQGGRVDRQSASPQCTHPSVAIL